MFIRRVLLLVIGIALAAQAYVAPGVLFQRTRAAKALTTEQRDRAHAAAKALSRTSTPEELAEQLANAPLAYRLYLAVAHVELRDDVIDAYGVRVDLLERAHDLLDAYLEDVQEALKVNFDGPVGPPLPEPSPGVPEIVDTPETLRVLRVLPRPNPATTREQLRVLALAGEADRRTVEELQEKTSGAEGTYLDVQRSWSAYLHDLAEKTRKLSEGDLQAEAAHY